MCQPTLGSSLHLCVPWFVHAVPGFATYERLRAKKDVRAKVAAQWLDFKLSERLPADNEAARQDGLLDESKVPEDQESLRNSAAALEFWGESLKA